MQFVLTAYDRKFLPELPFFLYHCLFSNSIPPLLQYKFWNDAETCPSIGPFDYFRPLGNFGAKATGMWRDANSSEIKSV